ncbi:hypothetical protein BJ960_002469 [Leucobacter aridicollis]|uniref:Uncharacterized protein n=1 Tax=Leucobacter aridicollis TaxID=283878 RepID=A0A852RE68_9MICO|nr:hypothetical protein [Leucobacter aridicollis]
MGHVTTHLFFKLGRGRRDYGLSTTEQPPHR